MLHHRAPGPSAWVSNLTSYEPGSPCRRPVGTDAWTPPPLPHSCLLGTNASNLLALEPLPQDLLPGQHEFHRYYSISPPWTQMESHPWTFTCWEVTPSDVGESQQVLGQSWSLQGTHTPLWVPAPQAALHKPEELKDQAKSSGRFSKGN